MNQNFQRSCYYIHSIVWTPWPGLSTCHRFLFFVGLDPSWRLSWNRTVVIVSFFTLVSLNKDISTRCFVSCLSTVANDNNSALPCDITSSLYCWFWLYVHDKNRQQRWQRMLAFHSLLVTNSGNNSGFYLYFGCLTFGKYSTVWYNI